MKKKSGKITNIILKKSNNVSLVHIVRKISKYTRLFMADCKWQLHLQCSSLQNVMSTVC